MVDANSIAHGLARAGVTSNPLNRVASPTGTMARGVVVRLAGSSGQWKLIGERFGLNAMGAELHRRALEMGHGTTVKKVLANTTGQHWQFYGKVVTRMMAK